MLYELVEEKKRCDIDLKFSLNVGLSIGEWVTFELLEFIEDPFSDSFGDVPLRDSQLPIIRAEVLKRLKYIPEPDECRGDVVEYLSSLDLHEIAFRVEMIISKCIGNLEVSVFGWEDVSETVAFYLDHTLAEKDQAFLKNNCSSGGTYLIKERNISSQPLETLSR